MFTLNGFMDLPFVRHLPLNDKIMPKLLTFCFGIFLLISCSKEKNVEFHLPSNSDVQAIITAIIKHDSLPVLLNHKDSYALSSDILEFKLLTSDSITPPIMPGTGIKLKDLLLVKADSSGNHYLFSHKDSTYFRFLEKAWLRKRTAITNLRENGVKVESLLLLEEALNESQEKANAFFIFSNPVFSQDQTKAYIELTFACDRLCGYGHSFSLKNEKGKWRVVHKEITYFE